MWHWHHSELNCSRNLPIKQMTHSQSENQKFKSWTIHIKRIFQKWIKTTIRAASGMALLMNNKEVLKKQLCTWEPIKRIETQAVKTVYVSTLPEGGELVSMKVQYKSCNTIPLCWNCAPLKYIKYQIVISSSIHCFEAYVVLKKTLETQSLNKTLLRYTLSREIGRGKRK